MSTNSLFTFQMSYPFSFRLSVPGITNPFLSPSQFQNRPKAILPSALSIANSNSWALPAPAYRRRPSPGPAPPPLVRKRGWVPSSAEPSKAATISASTTGILDKSAKDRDMSDSQHEDDAGEEVTLDLPPSKRRKGVTGSVISTAYNAALVGAAVGLTVYRMWRDRGKEPEQVPPPPYQEEWVNSKRPISPSKPQIVLSQSQSVQPQSRSHSQIQRSQKGRAIPPARRHAGSGRHRQKLARPKVTRAARDTSPKRPLQQIQQHVQQEVVMEEEQDISESKDEMDWIGDKLARLIEEGKRALGKEIVVSSDAPEDEVDDGSGNWVEEDEPEASTSYASSYRSRPITIGSPSRSSRHKATYSIPPTSPRRPTFANHSRFLSGDTGASVSRPITPSQLDFAPESTSSMDLSSMREAENEWASPHIQESMERARAAYRQRHGLGS
ncbi:hypothetical protein DFH11DRAFT_1579958 [Phellopilus nigrolimitatus]|nr:hypothetical protein DFH11DRAFT_1579958 [Phellopilus nigrolimitatus]